MNIPTKVIVGDRVRLDMNSGETFEGRVVRMIDHSVTIAPEDGENKTVRKADIKKAWVYC